MNTKRVAALLLAGLLAVLPGCDRNEGPATGDVAMGRYIEQEWTLPQDISYVGAVAVRPADSRVEIFSSDGEDGGLYYSTGDGQEWTEDPPAWVEELYGAGHIVQSISYNSQGEGVVCHYGDHPETGEWRYLVSLLDRDGNRTLTPIGTVSGKSTDLITIEIPKGGEDKALVISETSTGIAVPEDQDDAFAEAPAAHTAQPEEGDGGEEPGEDSGDEEDEGGGWFYVSAVLLGDNGLVYAQSFNDIICYDPATGEQLYTVKSVGNNNLALYDDMIVQAVYAPYNVESGTDTITFYDDRGREDRQVPADMLTGLRTLLYGNAENGLFAATAGGIYHLTKGGELWERMVDGSLTSLSLPALTPYSLLIHGDNEFLVHTLEGESRLFNYAYSPETPTRPDTELTVYTLREDSTVRQAVGAFRQKNPNVLVNVEVLGDADGAATEEDAIRALNTELLAGKGPDLLVLDGLPLDSYVEKGVLANLSPLLEEMLGEGLLYENLARTFEGESGVYAIPARFQLPTVWGLEEAVSAAATTSSLATWATLNPEKRVFYNQEPSSLITALYPYSYNSWIVDGAVDGEALAAFLQDVNVYSTLAGERKQLWAPDAVVNYSQFSRLRPDIDVMERALALSNGYAELLHVQLTGFSSATEPNGAVYARDGGALLASSIQDQTSVADSRASQVFRVMGDGAYLPTSIVGVNAASPYRELAQEFVRTVLEADTQTADLGDGFPVNREAVTNNLNKKNDIYMSYVRSEFEDSGLSYDDTLSMEMGWPSRGMFTAITDTFGTLSTPLMPDNTLMETILDESKPYFDGSITLEEAVAAISDKMRLVLAE